MRIIIWGLFSSHVKPSDMKLFLVLTVTVLLSTHAHAQSDNPPISGRDVQTLTVSVTALTLSILAIVRSAKKQPSQRSYTNDAIRDHTPIPSFESAFSTSKKFNANGLKRNEFSVPFQPKP